YWFWSEQLSPGESASIASESTSAPPDARRETQVVPDIPAQLAPETLDDVVPSSRKVVERLAPSPATSDEQLRQVLSSAGFNALLMPFISDQHPVDISAALIDGLGRGMLLRKILPADPPKTPFGTTVEGGVTYMSAASYRRYDLYADAIAALDVAVLAEAFHRLRSGYEMAFERLGLDSQDFDNAILRSLDVVLSTPEITEPIALERKSVMYLYVDPELEKLPSAQKQLLRTGPENIRRIKQVAQSLRDRLLQE
ncbi:MAG: DUF3014 domain-containing protein, partial [Halioglobus sp.]